MTNIREFAEKIGFEIVGKLHRMDNIDRSTRFYMDDDENEYLIDIRNKTICIITKDGAVI